MYYYMHMKECPLQFFSLNMVSKLSWRCKKNMNFRWFITFNTIHSLKGNFVKGNNKICSVVLVMFDKHLIMVVIFDPNSLLGKISQEAMWWWVWCDMHMENDWTDKRMLCKILNVRALCIRRISGALFQCFPHQALVIKPPRSLLSDTNCFNAGVPLWKRILPHFMTPELFIHST